VGLAPQVDPPFAASYRAILRDGQHRELRRIEGLHPNEHETLVLLLPAGLLPPGDYGLQVDGLTAGGQPTAAGRYTFRVLPPA
jgi:hypothetical protein